MTRQNTQMKIKAFKKKRMLIIYLNTANKNPCPVDL